nr:Tn7-like element transposition protein TnsE [Phosphitispora fastidiosa]
MIFVNNPEINRVAKYEQQINQGDSYVSKQGKGGAAFIAASVDESIAGGSIQPIEFKTLEIVYETDSFELEDFYEMIKRLEEIYPKLRISMNLVNLPPGRKFSWLPDGRRRVCAIVNVCGAGGRTAYILEVARPDQRSLSTLIVQFPQEENREQEEKAIKELLINLVLNSGNWPTKLLKNLNHTKLRHTSTDPHHWAERVYEKIIYFLLKFI